MSILLEETTRTSGEMRLKKIKGVSKTPVPQEMKKFKESILDKITPIQQPFFIYKEKPKAVEVHKLHKLHSKRHRLRHILYLQITEGEENYIAELPNLAAGSFPSLIYFRTVLG